MTIVVPELSALKVAVLETEPGAIVTGVVMVPNDGTELDKLTVTGWLPPASGCTCPKVPSDLSTAMETVNVEVVPAVSISNPNPIWKFGPSTTAADGANVTVPVPFALPAALAV